jgi:hypothetical protein
MTPSLSQRGRGLTEQAADAAIGPACRAVRLPTLRSRFAEAAAEGDRTTSPSRPALSCTYIVGRVRNIGALDITIDTVSWSSQLIVTTLPPTPPGRAACEP